MAHKLQTEMDRNKELTRRVEGVQGELIERNDLEKRFLELRNAHTAQQGVVMKLQDELSKTTRLRTTLQTQETVIQKLETALHDTLGASSRDRLTAFFTSLKSDDVEGGIRRLMAEENKVLRERVLELERRVGECGGGGGKVQVKGDGGGMNRQDGRAGESGDAVKNPSPQTSEWFRLLLRAERAESRVRALEEELVENAKTFAETLVKARYSSPPKSHPLLSHDQSHSSPPSRAPSRIQSPTAHHPRRELSRRGSVVLDPIMPARSA
ncbi:hypothetical protein HK104_001267 [Borealophlyctis nickersoniae]|nr:hypothetical protein HK104_001267 [Borealophlyctis nickersoniae]